MTSLYDLAALKVPEGEVLEARTNGALIWKKHLASYVSLGDSIAAGYLINDDWTRDYGTGSEYGENGNASTAIVPGCYTDLVRSSLEAGYPSGRVNITSFAHSGDTVADLMEKLDHAAVRDAIARADMVTVCIGANDVLQPALMDVNVYIETGDLSNAEAIIEANMAALANDSGSNSYASLLNKLESINPGAKFAFMTIYNPYKYLWLDEGHDGFFSPILDTIPEMTILWSIEVDKLIKDGLLSTSVVQLLFDRVNGLCDWAEQRVTRLNEVISGKVSAKRASNPNFYVVDVKAAFDPVPDRPVSAEHHYNDLVNVEFTRGYDTAKTDWGALWRDEYGDNVAAYWFDLVMDHISGSGFDLGGLASDLVSQTVEKVIAPNVDPHPEAYGHEVIKASFSGALGW